MKKTGVIFLILLYFITLCSSPFCVNASQIGNVESSGTEQTADACHGMDAPKALLGAGQLVDNAQATFMYEANSDTVMHAWNADALMEPASLVKIMTALIAVEKGDLNDTITVTQSAIESVPYDAVSCDLIAGETVLLEHLLYCLLLDSANDAAAVIAEHISGSQSEFVQMMNEYAHDLGCTCTQFRNVHGLHDDAQHITARDAARILNAALKNEVFYKIFTAEEYTVPSTNKSEDRELVTGNFMMDESSRLYYDSRVIGGRTGVTEDGMRCLASVAENDTMRLICVVMGAESVYQEDGYTAVSVGGYKETTALLDAGFNGYRSVQILFANQALKQSSVIDGDSDVVLGPQISISTVLPADTTISDLSFRYAENNLYAPITAGDRLSSVQVWYGGLCVAEADLYAMNSVEHINTLQTNDQAQHSDSLWSGTLITILIILGGVLALFVILRFGNKIRIMLLLKRSKRYRRSRRRSR